MGDEIEALVLQKEDKEGRLILSKKRAQYERAWGTIEEKKDNDEVVEGTVIEVVKGGLILDIGLRGFLPASLVEMRRVRDLQPYVGKTLEAKIIELDKNRNNVVLSRRAWLEQTQSEVRSEFLNKLAKGQVRTGVVSSIVNFGAFVDLGGVDGLVHVSELSWKHIDHPSEVVEVGQEVTVEVLDIDLDRERVSLSLKATQEDPWRHFARTHQIGQVVPGQGHQAGSVRRVRARPGRHRGPGAHLRARRAARRDPRAGRQRRRRPAGQGHRHRPRAPAHLAVAEAGQRGRAHRGLLRPGAVRHGSPVRRQGQLHLPRGLRPGDPGMARGLRRGRARSGRSATPPRASVSRRTRSSSRTRRRPTPQAATETGEATSYSSDASRRRAPTPTAAARSPRTRRSTPCARSSPVADPHARHEGPEARLGPFVCADSPLARSRVLMRSASRGVRAAITIATGASAASGASWRCAWG